MMRLRTLVLVVFLLLVAAPIAPLPASAQPHLAATQSVQTIPALDPLIVQSTPREALVGQFRPHGEWWRLRFYVPALLALGALVVAAGYFAWMWALDRTDRGSGLLALLTASAAGQLVAEIYLSVVEYAYPQQLTPMVTVTTLAAVFSVMLAAFLSQRFAPGLWRVIAAATAGLVLVAMVLVPGFENKALAVFAVAGVVAGGLAVRGVRAGQAGAVTTVIGVGIFLAALIIQPGLFHDRGAYLAVSVLMVALFIAQVIAARRREHDAQAVRSQATRLELELLKSQLAPHVLLNTLTALSEWVESDPKTGSRMIDALADELRSLSQISGKSLITVGEEIALCRNHLALMSLQRDRPFSLRTQDLDEMAMIPPAIFHTVIENALTHNRYPMGGVFTLKREAVAYVIDAPPGEGRAAKGQGRGGAYVEGRLTEAFGADWKLVSGPSTDGGWRTVIEVPV